MKVTVFRDFQQVCVFFLGGGGRIQGPYSALFIGWSYPEAKRCHGCRPYHAAACVQTWGGETESGVHNEGQGRNILSGIKQDSTYKRNISDLLI